MVEGGTIHYTENSYEYLKKIGMDENYEERMLEFADDKAAREKEWQTAAGMMQFERAGLSDEEKKKIPKLNENNNVSYQYLRSKGNTWEYNPDDVHVKMKNRFYRRFDTFDKENDGVMTITEILYWADRMKSLCQSNDEEIEKVRDALRNFFKGYGLNEEGLHRENWVEANQVFAEAERERKKQGESSVVASLGNSYYDILDEDGDNKVTLPELKRMMNVFRIPEEAAYTFFETADVNKNGTIEREEMHALIHKFWLEKYDPTLDGLYAYKF